MHRQSLGSPLTKHHLNDAHKLILSPNANNMFNGQEEDEDEEKKLKLKHNVTTPETYIHVIPMLTLLCILILYLSSYPPSQNDMAQFDGFNHLHKAADLGELEGMVDNKRVAVIRSLKNIIKKWDELKNRRLNRKIGRAKCS